MAERVGFIGLGHMGRPMARNLLAAGFPLTVHNRSQGPVEELAAAGAAPARSPMEVAQVSDIVITMLPDSPDVEAVVTGPNGVAEGLRPGAVVIDMSTILPAVSRRLAEALEVRGGHWLDAPVSGGPQGAAAATLSIMVGGREEDFARGRPVFEALGKTVVHVGPAGAGSTAKLCNQVACVLNLLGVAEALVLAEKAGLDPNRLFQAIRAGSAGSWMMENQAPKMIARDFAPGFFVRLQQKDLRLVLATAEECGAPLPGAALVNQIFRILEADGKGELGTQAIFLAIEKLAGLDPSPPQR